jgi:hypothetical protein
LQEVPAEDDVKNPAEPDTQRDEYMPEAPNAHKTGTPAPDQEGINPRDPSSMPRGEEDEQTRANSPEFHDRPPTTPIRRLDRSTD